MSNGFFFFFFFRLWFKFPQRLVIGLFLRRVLPFKNNACYWTHSIFFVLGCLCVFVSFALGFVYIGTGTHLSLKTPTRGTHSISALTIMTLVFMVALIRGHALSRDVHADQRSEPTYRAYDQIVITVVLLGAICLYCGFADYSTVDPTAVVTSWYWIYGICIGFWVTLFLIFEIRNLWHHHLDDLALYKRIADEDAVIAASGMTPRTYRRRELARKREEEAAAAAEAAGNVGKSGDIGEDIEMQ